ncbi:RABF1 [Symbiodinium natans]|uniref:RABF1 protein n=1 Tax=Symbiodinium natans TaxID=878477 RepID=A0A812MYS1_9DINO|nr:RABF1 [Symbiodinium natans]
MPTVSAMMQSAQRAERATQGPGCVRQRARFHPDAACSGQELGMEEDDSMDYSDVNDYWFDWAQLERAEAKARSRSVPAGRREGVRPMAGPACSELAEAVPAQGGERSHAVQQAPTPARARGSRARAPAPRRSGGGCARRGTRPATTLPVCEGSVSEADSSESDGVQAIAGSAWFKGRTDLAGAAPEHAPPQCSGQARGTLGPTIVA